MSKIMRRPAVLLALCLCSVGAVVTLLGRLAAGPAVAMKKVELGSEVGAKAYPAFSPDGRRLVYSARATSSKDETSHVFTRDMPDGKPQQLTSGPANDISPVFSPDGTQIAFVRLDPGQAQGECVIISSSGGGDEKKFPGCAAPGDETQPFPALSWMPDGQSLVAVQQANGQPASVAVLSLKSGEIQPISHPPAGHEDSTPAVSPDGTTIAFVRASGTEGADIYLSDPTGANARAVTFDDRPIRGIAWTRDGQDLLYAGQRAGGWRLWRLPAYGGSPRDLIIAGREAQYVAVAPAGGRLVYTMSATVSSIWRSNLNGKSEEPEEHVVIRSPGRENGARYSTDGKRIADISDQTGNDEIWVCDADGGNRVQVTSMKGPDLARIRWSPDGKSLIFDADGPQGNDLYVVPAVAGAKPVRVQIGALNGSWSHDGKSIYFQAHEHIWKSSADGGSPEQLGAEGGVQPVESVDGKYIYYRRNRSFWRIPIGGGDAEEAIVPEHDLMWSTTIQPTREGMYYIEWERSSRQPVVSFYDFAAKKSSVVFRMKHAGGRINTYSVSPDGKYLLYARVDQSQTNIEVVENFR